MIVGHRGSRGYDVEKNVALFRLNLAETLGVSQTEHSFYPAILGAVLFGIGLALLLARAAGTSRVSWRPHGSHLETLRRTSVSPGPGRRWAVMRHVARRAIESGGCEPWMES